MKHLFVPLVVLALGIKNYSVLQEQLDRYTVYLSPINPTGGLNCAKSTCDAEKNMTYHASSSLALIF